MPSPEQRVVDATTRMLDRRRVVHFNIAGGNGETGLPDRMAVYRGRAIFMEFKAPGTGRVAPKQRWWLDRLRGAGALAVVVSDAQTVADLLDVIDTIADLEAGAA